MHARVRTVALWGIEAVPVTVEADAGDGLPRTHIVGLPDATVRESQERIVSAFKQAGLEMPAGRITINLSPSDLRKSGGQFDLPIALAICLSGGTVPRAHVEGLVFLGELGLDGGVRPVAGVLPAARWAREAGMRALVVPEENAPEAAVAGLPVWPVRSLAETIRLLTTDTPRPVPPAATVRPDASGLDLADVRGQLAARRALEIAAAGGHNLLFVGPPGAGKTLLARCLVQLLPRWNDGDALEATCVHSAAGLLRPGAGLLPGPPFRAPHHTISTTALVGGGGVPRPGEVSLAHRGVLFLDELPEFRRDALEALRQPLEEGSAAITRARYAVRFPARFQLVAAMNPCPCGNAGDAVRVCRCAPHRMEGYRRRVSGPLLDRIDLQVEVSRVEAKDLQERTGGESTQAVRARVHAAARIQQRRRGRRNADLTLRDTERLCRPEQAGRRLLADAMDTLGLSARGYHRVLRVARTLADLAGTDGIEAAAVAEALQYRVFDRTARAED